MKGGLRALYRTLELPGANPLKDAHAALDAAVLAAYGFSAKKDLLAQLLALNLDVAARSRKANLSRLPASRPASQARDTHFRRLHPTPSGAIVLALCHAQCLPACRGSVERCIFAA